LSLVTFDEKSPTELLELLNDVLKNLSSEHDVDVRNEGIENTAMRIFRTFAILKFDYQGDPQQLQNSLQSGDRELFYPLLSHILSKLPDLRKRAYLAKFLTPIDVPEEMFADPDIMEKFQQYKDLQEQFKITHKETERIRGTSLQPTELKREVSQLEEEKSQLKTKINKLEQRLKKNENFNELYEVTSKLRKEQEVEVKLAEQLMEREMSLKQEENRYFQAKKKLQDLQLAASNNSSGEELLQKLKEDVEMTQNYCKGKLPEDIKQKETRLVQVQQVLNRPPVTDRDIEREQSEIHQLNMAIEELQERQRRTQKTGDDKLSMFRNQALLVSRKKADAMERLQMLKEELKDAEKELNEKREKMGHKPVDILKGDDLLKYGESLKGKVKVFKKKKGELSSIVAERGILARTEDILKTRHGDQTEFLASLERQRGVEGAFDLQSKLEEVSEKTAEVNKEKEVSLEEISRRVTEINNTIKEKKNVLAPLIKELRQVRADFTQLETEYNDKKKTYENTAVGLDAERDKLLTEVTAYYEDCKREESRFHYLNAMINSTKITLDRARLEEQGKNRIGDAGQSYRELYQSRIQQQENLSKKLRETQKLVKENHDVNLEQANMFRDLRKILAFKLKVLRTEVSGESGVPGGTNHLIMD